MELRSEEGLARNGAERLQQTGIPQDVNLNGAEILDPAVTRELFDLGYQRALDGPGWQTLPPGFGSPSVSGSGD